MSAPPLATHPTMPTVVSRLPKFGPRGKAAPDGAQLGPSAAGPSARLTNGFYHHPGPAGVNSSSAAPVRQNGFIRVPTSFSMKWRKENGTMEGGGTDGEKDWKRGNGGNVGQNRSSNNISQQASPGQSQHDARKPTASSMGKGRGVGQPVTPSSSPSPQSSPRTLPVPKASQCGLSNGTKQALNGLPGSKARSGASSSLRQPQAFAFSGSRPGSGSGFGFRSGSPLQKKPPATRSQSTDSLGGSAAVQLTDGDRFRSRSLTQVRQQPSPTLTPSRSGSNVRAAEKGVRERSASSPQAPHRGSLAKSPVSRALEGGAKGGEVKGHSSGASGGSGGGLTSVLPPSALKKPLLPSLAPTSKPSGVSYKLSRPSLVKQSRPLRVTSANGPGPDPEGCRNSAETPSTSPDSSPEAPGSEGAEPLSYAEVTLEDMSLSSTSSLDRNDTSQEYMDDFDNLGNGGVGVLLSPKNDEDDSGLDQSCGRFDDDFMSINAVSKTTGLCFLEDGVDWAGMRLCGERAAPGFARFSHQRRPSQADCHDQGGSSLDLSPSDSCGSGGTYLWDEEGLEPLGGTSASINTTHHVGSFDSDLNSVDILNNLDSCDLEDDDLMLDADLAEDGSLHSDGDGMSHMAQWRRRQLCWGMQDAHNNDGDLQCYQLTEDPGNQRTAQDSGLVLALCPPRSPSLSPATPGLGLDVEELAEDCSSVRSQLEFLQRLLLQEDEVDDDTLTTDTVSPDTESSHSSDSQVQALLQEVQQLREELRSRDRTIAQLTLNLAVPTATTRCCCQETTRRMDQYTQTSVTERESVASQTPWSDHNSQILHASFQRHQEPLTGQAPRSVQAPATPCSPQPQIPPDGLPPREGRKQQNVEMKEKRATHSRSLLLPSRLLLFPSQTSRPACGTSAARPLSNEPDGNGSSGVRLKSLGFASGFSRLPKPKSY